MSPSSGPEVPANTLGVNHRIDFTVRSAGHSRHAGTGLHAFLHTPDDQFHLAPEPGSNCK
jgi:hypothetical protein